MNLSDSPPHPGSRDAPVSSRWADKTRTTSAQTPQKDLRALAVSMRADAEGWYDNVEPGWQAGVEWTLL
ncbi:hypothetical protein [Streptomyces anulatus]|uniref:hypothetical protein n=1 Tax=Streptomyces anulatus TaxID=1892 RepID=UPI0033ED373C